MWRQNAAEQTGNGGRMYTPSPADELAEIRAEMARLKAREVVVCALLLTQQTLPSQRPGWPIQRDVQHISAHG
jgi:hypothetical protein